MFAVGQVGGLDPAGVLARIGARKTLVRIMASWGVITIATMFVQDEITFYDARLLLGVAEAGFFPGALFFLSRWFPSDRRTRMTAIFFVGVPISGVLGSLVSGGIMHAFGGVGGLADVAARGRQPDGPLGAGIVLVAVAVCAGSGVCRRACQVIPRGRW